jgi:hypothetical protein
MFQGMECDCEAKLQADAAVAAAASNSLSKMNGNGPALVSLDANQSMLDPWPRKIAGVRQETLAREVRVKSLFSATAALSQCFSQDERNLPQRH